MRIVLRVCGKRSSAVATRSIVPREKKNSYFFFFSRERCERIPCSCRFAGVPKPLVDWHGMRVFPRWWSIYSKKARYWPQRGSCVVRTARFMGGRTVVFAATVHVHVTAHTWFTCQRARDDRFSLTRVAHPRVRRTLIGQSLSFARTWRPIWSVGRLRCCSVPCVPLAHNFFFFLYVRNWNI